LGSRDLDLTDLKKLREAVRRPEIIPISTSEYPTLAKRPMNSVLSCDKLRATFGVDVGHWYSNLLMCKDEP